MNRFERYQAERTLSRSEPAVCQVELGPADHRPDNRTRWLFRFGAYGWTTVLVLGGSLEDALDEAIDWLADNAPGLLADEQVKEEYDRLIGVGKSHEEAAEEAERDTTIGGNSGHYLNSWEWTVDENPGRAAILGV